jgi:hypothetical protein
MKARYIDVDEGSPRRVRFAGKSFPLGVFIDVSDLDEKVQAKLGGNPTFEVSDEPLNAADEAALAAADTAFSPARANPFDQDGDGQPGGPVESAEKDQLLDELDALAQKHPDAVKFDRRWGVRKLREALEAAKFEVGDE